MTVKAQLDAADHALCGAQQDVLGLVVGGRAAVRAGAALLVVPGPDAEGVADDEPARARAPRGLDHERAGQVAAPGGNADPSRPEPEVARAAIQHGREHAGAVGPR